MNQNRYIQELAYYLRSLPEGVRDHIIDYYQEQFREAKEAGRSEADTVLMLGRPKANAEKELAIYSNQMKSNRMEKVVDQQEQQESRQTETGESFSSSEPRSTSERVPKQPINYLMLILLIIFNLIVVLGPVLGVFLTGIGIWVTSFVLMATPLIAVWVDGMLAFPALYPIFATTGLGILLFVGMNFLSQLATRAIRAYFRAMDRLVRGN